MFWWNPQDVLLMGTFWTDWCSLSNSNAKKTSFLMNPSVLLHLHSVCSLDTLYKLLYTLVIHWRTHMMLCQEERCSFGIPRDLVRSLSLHELFSEFRNFDIDNWYFWKVTKTDFLLAVSEGFNILPPKKGQIVMICCWTSSKIFFYIFLSWHWYIGSATNNKNQKHFVLLPISLFTFQLQQTEVSICGLEVSKC